MTARRETRAVFQEWPGMALWNCHCQLCGVIQFNNVVSRCLLCFSKRIEGHCKLYSYASESAQVWGLLVISHVSGFKATQGRQLNMQFARCCNLEGLGWFEINSPVQIRFLLSILKLLMGCGKCGKSWIRQAGNCVKCCNNGAQSIVVQAEQLCVLVMFPLHFAQASLSLSQ